jgi:hypothetical protein
MYVNNRGELLRGNFARQVSSTAAKGAFYSRDGVESGHFMRMPSPQRQARSHPTPHLAQPRRANVQIPRRAQPSPVAMAKLAALARRARGGDRQAQAQIASLKRMAAARAHPGRVSGNAVNEAYESITSYRRQRSILDNALESVDTPTSDNEITALVGCPPTVGDNFDPREFFAAVEEVAPEKITNIVGAMGFPNIAHAVRRAQQGDPRARAAIQRVAHTVNQAKAQKMQRRAKLAKLCARLAGRVGASPLPEPPSEAAILFNGENFIGPPLVGCPPMPVGVNPLTVGLIESPLVGCPPLPRV